MGVNLIEKNLNLVIKKDSVAEEIENSKNLEQKIKQRVCEKAIQIDVPGWVGGRGDGV